MSRVNASSHFQFYTSNNAILVTYFSTSFFTPHYALVFLLLPHIIDGNLLTSMCSGEAKIEDMHTKTKYLLMTIYKIARKSRRSPFKYHEGARTERC